MSTTTLPGTPPAGSDVAFSCAPTSLVLRTGDTGTVNCTATSVGGYFGWVFVGCTTDRQSSCTFGTTTSSNLAPGGSTTFVAQVAPVRPYPIGGTSSKVTINSTVPYSPNRSRTVTVGVEMPGLSVICRPTDVTLYPSGSFGSDCTVTGTHGFGGTVTPSCSAQDGYTCAVSTPTLTLPENGTASFRVSLGVGSDYSYTTSIVYVSTTATGVVNKLVPISVHVP